MYTRTDDLLLSLDVCLGAEHGYDNLPPHPGLAQRNISMRREGRAPGTCSWQDLTLHAQRDIGLAQAGAGGRDTQLGQIAEAPLEGRIAEGSPGRGEPTEAFRGPTRAQSAAVADHESAAVELAARQLEKSCGTE